MSQPPAQRPKAKSSYFLAYFLCITLGWLGVHRFYLKRYWSGVLYALSFGILGVGILVDLMTLPVLVKEQRDLEAGIRRRPELAPWAAHESKGLFCYIQLLIRYAILIFMPALVVVTAISLGQYTIVVLMFLIMAFSLLIGSVGRCLGVMSDFSKEIELVPFLPNAIGVIQKFDRHYMQNRVGSVFYYLLYPLFGPLSLLFSSSARSEFRCYLGIFSILLLTIAGENLLSYNTIYPTEYYSLEFGIEICLLMAAIGIALCFACVIPVVSSSFYMDMTGRGLSLRFCSGLGLIIAGLAVYWVTQNSTVTFRGALTASKKLYESDKFREEMRELTGFFLEQEAVEMDRSSMQFQIEIDDDLTEWYHKVVAGILREEEVGAFRVIKIDHEGQLHMAIQFVPDPIGMIGLIGDDLILFSISPDGNIVEKRDDPRNVVMSEFKHIDLSHISWLHLLEPQNWKADELNFRKPEMITSEKMFGDLKDQDSNMFLLRGVSRTGELLRF